ncbi:hypothetical protein V5O48_009606 [Marasmius crinis-equi]|uniref:Uncharacterized protein n=1 Tax=Marasmius crinis-equi TaxID=585013 RepID=A0ABR3FAN0_9AGAR
MTPSFCDGSYTLRRPRTPFQPCSKLELVLRVLPIGPLVVTSTNVCPILSDDKAILRSRLTKEYDTHIKLESALKSLIQTQEYVEACLAKQINNQEAGRNRQCKRRGSEIA